MKIPTKTQNNMPNNIFNFTFLKFKHKKQKLKSNNYCSTSLRNFPCLRRSSRPSLRRYVIFTFNQFNHNLPKNKFDKKYEPNFQNDTNFQFLSV